jgi:5'-nucleotidase
VVERRSPKPLVRVRFLHRPQNIKFDLIANVDTIISDLMKTVLVDMDGVIVNYMGHVLLTLKHKQNQFFPEISKFSYEDIISHNFEELFENIEIKKFILKTYTLPGMFLYPQPIRGSIEAMRCLADHFNIFLCSSPFSGKHDADHVWTEKVQWVRKYLGERWVDRLILTRDKTVISGEILIDDKSNIQGVNENPIWKQVLFDQPWNKTKDDLPRLIGWNNPQKIVTDLQNLIAS